MLTIGEHVPEARLWSGPNEPVPLRDLYADGTILLLFYLFDWSST